jgi:hypothetical protein
LQRPRAVLFREIAEDALRSAGAAVLREVVLVPFQPLVDEGNVRRSEVDRTERAVNLDELLRDLIGVEL